MIFFNSQRLIDNVIAEIDQAQSSIDIEIYIWDPDKVGYLFEDALKRAVQRGVQVRVIVDRIGSFEWVRTRMDSLVKDGVDVRVFRPLPAFKNFIQHYPKKIVSLIQMFNRRDHRKIFIIDKKVAYVGSLNIMEPALKWKETTLRVIDQEEIEILNEIFESTWDWVRDDLARFKDRDFRKIIFQITNSEKVRTTQTKVLRWHYKKDILRKIYSARKRIWLVTPYFNPPSFLLKALVKAANRGVDVRLMVPKTTDPAWFTYLSRVYYSPLVKRGLRVFEYKKGILHSKTALIDHVGVVGSGNLNFRSFYRDLELNMIVSEISEVEALEKEFIRDMALSHEIKRPGDLKIWERAFGSFLMKFKTSF